MNIEFMKEEDILELKLSQVAKLSTPHWIHTLMNQVRSELTAKHIPFCPHFWFSTEWFCPDGVSGMAIPYYLLHPKLQKLEKKYTRHVEGITEKEFMQLARHELGHVMDNVYQLRKLKKRNHVFGSTKIPYPSSYFPDPHNKNYVRYLKGYYAQAHPEEDWAETFAVWLDTKSNWKVKYANWPALDKLKYLDNVMSNLMGTAPKSIKRKMPFNIKNDHRTLRQYFIEKQIERKLNRRNFYLQKLPRIFQSTEGKQLHQVISSNEKQLIQLVKNKSKSSFQTLRPMIKLLKEETKNKYLCSKTPDEKVIRVLSNIIINEENRFKKQGRHRIIM